MTKPIQLIDLGELVGRAEIAQRAGIKLQTVDTWRRRYETFPEPIGTISGTPLWLWPAVEAWIRDTPRDVGRPGSRRSPALLSPIPDRLRRAIRKDEHEDRAEARSSSA